MHETVIAMNIIKEAEKHGKVKSISLEIGELAHVPAQDLISTLSRLTSWKINFKEIKSKVKCNCGYSGNPTILDRGHDFFMIECPKCKQTPDILEGTDIKIKDITVN